MTAQQTPPPATASPKPPKVQKVQPYYNYQSLPEGHIRLLRIQASLPDSSRLPSAEVEKDIHVTIETHSLQSCPPYIALSYTWGDATVAVDPAVTVFTSEPRCYPIYCEGLLLRGTRNLRDALRRLRQGKQTRAHSAYNESAFEKDALGDTDLYWIDALCVDQDDLAERSAQVVLMSKIYTQARSCVVYLGERDDTSKLALELVQKLAEDRNLNKQIKLREMGKVRDLVVQKMESLSKDEKNALSILLARRYFSRVWILQEVILARTVVGTLGSIVFDFKMLFFFGQLVSFAKTDLEVLALDEFTMGNHRFSGDKDDDPRPHQAALNLGVLGGSRVSLQRGEPPAFLEVVLMAFICSTTDERDRIYGILAISAELRDKDDKPTLPVDYHLSVEQVYANATIAFALRRNDLEFLSLVGEHKYMKIKTLASYCPDYSTRHFWIRNLGDASGWHIGRFWGGPPNIEFQDRRLLIADGICYDTLAGTATTGLFTASSDIIQCAKPSELLKLVLNLTRDDSHGSTHKSTTTRVNDLWRLLFMDDFVNLRPAPAVTALFLPNLIIHMFHFYVDRHQFGLTGGLTPHSPPVMEELAAMEQIIDEICRLEPESAPFLPEIATVRDELAAFKGAHADFVLFQSIADRAAAAKISSDLNELVPSSPGNAAPTAANLAAWEAFVRREVFTKMAARLFKQSYFSTARTGQLGIGYSSIAAGDQLWLLNGHSAPVVLRPLPNGNYRFLGETYVQGMMFREREQELKKTDLPMQRIKIE